MPRLVLVDGNAILHRAYHALPPLTTRSGQLVNAVYGFFSMLFRIVEDLEPTHLAVAFDTEKPTFRHAAYVGYQAHRPRLESDLAEQIALTQELLLAGGIPVFIAPGYEADDIIGTLAKQAAEINTNKYQSQISNKKKNLTLDIGNLKLEIIIVTGDRDLLQLVRKNVKVYAPVRGLTETHIFDEKEVKNYMGVTPAQIIDYKALIGDQSDNYPGVAGIGPKTAVGLLAQYKTFDGIYKNLVENKILDSRSARNKAISPSLIKKLVEGHQSGVLSRDLATIRTDAPVSFDLAKMEFISFAENNALADALGELGFKSLVARLKGGDIKQSSKKAIKDNNKDSEKQLRLV